MQSVLRAIFLDPEARAADTAEQPSDGHLRETILWFTWVWRGRGFVSIDPSNDWESRSDLSANLGQWPFHSPSVFNFFPPGYVTPGTSLNAPEFGIENTATVTGRHNLANDLLFKTITAFNVDLSTTSPLRLTYASTGVAPGVVQALNNLFLHGTMDTATAAAITSEMKTVPQATPRRSCGLASTW
jgi:Protein of unknown function (DUF1800)